MAKRKLQRVGVECKTAHQYLWLKRFMRSASERVSGGHIIETLSGSKKRRR
jgi:hypothetical protein